MSANEARSEYIFQNRLKTRKHFIEILAPEKLLEYQMINSEYQVLARVQILMP